ncbi:MAG: transporter substrate-binding domain-containing protein [Enterobacterales bacterium]|nr:transporter substrate-binding domain-containing protein [Enterobacterales bacterium]
MITKGKLNWLKLAIYLALLSIAFFYASFAISLQQEEYKLPERPLRIAVLKNNPPFSLKLPNQKIVGLYIDIWELWSKQTGIAVEFYSGDYANNVESLRNGIVDIQSGLFMNDDRRQWADFSIPVHRVTTGIFVLSKDDNDIEIENFSHKRIAVGASSYQERYLKSDYPTINIKGYKDPKQSILALLEGRVDAIVSEEPFIDAQLSIMGIKGAFIRSRKPFLVNTVHALIPKGQTSLLQLVNKGLSLISIDELIQAERKWLPGYDSYFASEAFAFLRKLSFKQQLWLRRHSRLNLSYQTDFIPIEFQDEKGKYAGISSEYIHLIEKKLDIIIVENPKIRKKIKALKYHKDDDIYTSIQEEDIDNPNMFSTQHYAKYPVVILSKKESEYISSLDSLEGKRVGVGQIGKVASQIEKAHPELNLIYFHSVNLGLDKLEVGEIDVYIDNLALVSYEIKSSNRRQIKIASPTPYYVNFSIGVKKELLPLVDMFNLVLSGVDQLNKTKLEDNWLDYQIKANPQYQRMLSIVVPLMFVLGFLILYIIRSNRKMAREIESRVVMEKKLSSETDKAENANMAKDEFLSNMSHEIRTPMNTIVGLVQLLAGTKLINEQNSYIETLKNSTNSLQYLIDDILDLSDIVNKELKLNKQSFHLKKLILTIIDQANYRAKNQDFKVPIYFNIDSRIPKIIKGDSVRLGQILLNLLSNAIKFTQEGQINIKVGLVDKVDNMLQLSFAVKDTGIGMSKEQCNKLFETYSQADTSTTRKYGGTGLGLSICKTLCEAMGGRIWAESKESIGSKFLFRLFFEAAFDEYLPFKKGQANHKPRIFSSPHKDNTVVSSESGGLIESFSHLEDLKLLVVDDNETNLLIVVTMLEKFKVTVFTAKNGKESIEVVANNQIDIILMDLQMPVMDGYQATKIIRQRSEYLYVPIIAFSANVMGRDIDKALQAGMNIHLAKPFSIAKLLKVISDQLAHASESVLGSTIKNDF